MKPDELARLIRVPRARQSGVHKALGGALLVAICLPLGGCAPPSSGGARATTAAASPQAPPAPVAALDANDPASVVMTLFTSSDPAILCSLLADEYREGAASLDFKAAGLPNADPVGNCHATVELSLARREAEGAVEVTITKADTHGDVAEVWAEGEGGRPFILVHLKLGDDGWLISAVAME